MIYYHDKMIQSNKIISFGVSQAIMGVTGRYAELVYH